MRNLDDDKTRYILILIFSIIASILMIIFTIPKVNALEVKAPNMQIGNDMYGYYVPLRDSTQGTTTKNYVNIGMHTIEFNNVRQTIKYGKGWLHPNNLPSQLLAIDSSLTNNQLWTTAINTEREIPIYYVADGINMGLYWGYHPAEPTSNYLDLFTTNDKWFYDGVYTYDFDIVVWGNGYNLNVGGDNSLIMLDNPFEYCSIWRNDEMSCSTGKIYPPPTVTVVKRERDYVHYKVSMQINGRWGMNETLYPNTNYPIDDVYFYNSLGFRLNGVPQITPVGDKHYNYYFSDPYNIVYWTSQSTITCPDRCVTDEDAHIDMNYNGASEIDSITDFNNVIGTLIARDYGFGGIINTTYGYIQRVLNYYNYGECVNVSVNFLGQDINMPCGEDFWFRSDMTTFRQTYEMIFTGIISYWLCWVIYKYILGILDPFKKPISSREVDSL